MLDDGDRSTFHDSRQVVLFESRLQIPKTMRRKSATLILYQIANISAYCLNRYGNLGGGVSISR
jgi:hypothetical protein